MHSATSDSRRRVRRSTGTAMLSMIPSTRSRSCVFRSRSRFRSRALARLSPLRPRARIPAGDVDRAKLAGVRFGDGSLLIWVVDLTRVISCPSHQWVASNPPYVTLSCHPRTDPRMTCTAWSADAAFPSILHCVQFRVPFCVHFHVIHVIHVINTRGANTPRGPGRQRHWGASAPDVTNDENPP